MHSQDSTPDAHPAERDDYLQALLLDLLIREYPAGLAPEEIRRHFEPRDDSFHVRDIFDRAARDLASYALVRYDEEFVVASRTGARAWNLFNRLA